MPLYNLCDTAGFHGIVERFFDRAMLKRMRNCVEHEQGNCNQQIEPSLSLTNS
ncbi:hypothetical protein LBWT_X0560 (plasmid) [Leptolyngbya boryana IAM M-101]|nr:hypothetical protein LBWT_X0560 [Leptolyngbya boryana IAM M-101]BAS66332.1 hypothetical protein LBDG_X0560 [Leptolyngbya boryana dg5]